MESDSPVRSVAIRLVRRAAAAAERHRASVFDRNLVALRIGDLRRSRHAVRTVRNDLDRRIAHAFSFAARYFSAASNARRREPRRAPARETCYPFPERLRAFEKAPP